MYWVCTGTYYDLSCCDAPVQDTILVVPPYPYSIEDRHDVALEDCWAARPQLFFSCHLRPMDARLPKNGLTKIGQDDIKYDLVFFSTFEELQLPIKGPMEDAGVVKLYEPSPTPCLYVAPAENMVGRIPLMPCFLAGNATPTIPHKYSKNKNSGFPLGCADAAAADGRRGSNVYEVNPWLWQFGRGKPRLGGLTIVETFHRKKAARDASDKRGKHTRERRKGDRA
jgi:hypothetical protein